MSEETELWHSINISRTPSTLDPAPLTVESREKGYEFRASLGPGFYATCMDVAQKKDNIVSVVAGQWDKEIDWRYQWSIKFNPKANIANVTCGCKNGELRISVKMD